MNWNEDADRLLIKLWNKGESLSNMAVAMAAAGYHLSRNAISGRKWRLPDEAFAFRPKPPKSVRPQRSEPVEKKKPVNIISPPIEPKLKPFDLSTWQGVNYLELKSDGCKAVLDHRGDDGLPKLCGRTQGFDLHGSRSVYCPEHLRLFTAQPKTPSRRVS